MPTPIYRQICWHARSALRPLHLQDAAALFPGCRGCRREAPAYHFDELRLISAARFGTGIIERLRDIAEHMMPFLADADAT